MKSAFGVDHGEVSKGLPSALRQPVKAGPGWEGNAVIHRVNAHAAGTRARANLSVGDPQGLGNNSQYYGLRSKNLYKETLGEITRSKARTKKKKVLP